MRGHPPSATIADVFADVFVVFGITGDLAKVMTFHSLYRLERRGLLDCPIVGVAGDDWTVEDLRERARKSIEACGETIDEQVFERFAARLSYLSAATSPTPPPTSACRGAIEDAHSPVFYLEIPPSLFGMMIKGLAGAGLTKSGRVVVEKPFGHDLASARALAAEIHEHLDESQLYRIDHFLGKMGTDELLYLRFGNTMIEPIWNRNHIACVQITMAESFGVEDRGHFYDPVGAVRDVVVNHLMQVVAVAAMEAPAGSDAETLKDAKFAVFRSTETADPAHYVRGQYDGYLDIDGVAKDSTTETYAAMRLRDRQLALGGRAVVHPHRQAAARHADRAARRVPATPRASASCEHGHRRPEPDQLVIKLDPSTGTRLILDAHRADEARPAGDHARHGVRRRRAARRPPPTRCCCSTRCAATARASPARTASRRPGAIFAAAARRPPAGAPVRARARGARRRRTRWSRGTAAGTGRGSAHVSRRAAARGAASPERRGALAVPADRRLRVPVGLPHRRAGRARRRDRLAVRAALRRAERVRHAARPRGRRLPLRAVRDQRADRARLRAGHQHAAHDLDDAERAGSLVRDALTLGPRRGEDIVTPHTRPPTDEDADHLLVRVALCLEGEVEIELTCEPVFDYGRVPAEWSRRRGRPPGRRQRRRS